MLGMYQVAAEKSGRVGPKPWLSCCLMLLTHLLGVLGSLVVSTRLGRLAVGPANTSCTSLQKSHPAAQQAVSGAQQWLPQVNYLRFLSIVVKQHVVRHWPDNLRKHTKETACKTYQSMVSMKCLAKILVNENLLLPNTVHSPLFSCSWFVAFNPWRPSILSLF